MTGATKSRLGTEFVLTIDNDKSSETGHIALARTYTLRRITSAYVMLFMNSPFKGLGAPCNKEI